MIVLADADLDKAATAVAANGYSFAGQSCISVQRVYVQDAAYDDFVARPCSRRSRRSSPATRSTRPPRSGP